jgi:hypothetical protein
MRPASAASGGCRRATVGGLRPRPDHPPLRGLVARLPLPEYAIGLGEAELAAGKVRAARRDLALVRVQQRLLARAGVNTDTELAVFESDHGRPARGLRLARGRGGGRRASAPPTRVRVALTRSGRPEASLRWARRARRLGSADPLFAFHAGMAARGAERRRLLRFALEARPRHAAVAGAAGTGGAAMRRLLLILVVAFAALARRRAHTRWATSP